MASHRIATGKGSARGNGCARHSIYDFERCAAPPGMGGACGWHELWSWRLERGCAAMRRGSRFQSGREDTVPLTRHRNKVWSIPKMSQFESHISRNVFLT